MLRKIIIAGITGGFVMILWTFITNGIWGFESRIKMKHIEAEPEVYEMLKAQITEPGRYICNPPLTAENMFPEGEPVFSILYGGIGHESAGKQMLSETLMFFLASFLAAWLLSQASEKILTSYKRKLLFYVVIGMLFAVFSELNNYGIANYPFKDALLLAINRMIIWTLNGMVVAAIIRPAKTEQEIV